jgi:hypothetical protein
MDKILRFIFILLFSMGLSALGQSTDIMQDVIFLKNGDKIKGYIIATDSVNTKILVFGDKLTIIGDSDIVHHEKQAPGKVLLFSERRFKPNGFQSQIEIMAGLNTFDRVSTGLRFINGYKFDNRHFIGIGVGAQRTNERFANTLYYGYASYPFFIRFSSDLWIKRSSPYIFSDLGTQFENSNFERLFKPGYFRLGIGNKLITKRAIIYSSLSYSYSKIRSYYIYSDYRTLIGQGDLELTDWYRNHNVEISFGLQFN